MHDPRRPLVTIVATEKAASYPEVSGRILPLDQALAHYYPDDVFILGYVAPADSEGRGYRLKKHRGSSPAADWEAGQATLLGCSVINLDIDRPGHTPWESEAQMREACAKMLEFFSSVNSIPLALHSTRAGIRVFFSFSQYTSPEITEQSREAVAAFFEASGIALPADPRAKDWVRLARAPRVVRSGTGPTWLPFEPVVWYMPEQAAVLPVLDRQEAIQAWAVEALRAHVEPPPPPVSATEVSTDWQTTKIAQVPEAVELFDDPAEHMRLAWDLEADGRIVPRAVTRRVAQMLGTVKAKKRLAEAVLHPQGTAAREVLPTKGGRNEWVFQLVSDVCEYGCKVLGVSASVALGIIAPLLSQLDGASGPEDDGRSWFSVAASRISERWAAKREARRMELIIAEGMPQDYAGRPIAQIMEDSIAVQRVAEAKQVSVHTIRIWAKLAEAVGREQNSFEKFLDWFAENGAGATDGMGHGSNAVLLDPDHQRYIPLPWTQLKAQIFTSPHLAPLKKHLYVETRDPETGDVKVTLASSPAMFGIRYLPLPWPKDYPKISPVRYEVDRRDLVSKTLHDVPTIWHQVDATLRPVYDQFSDSFIRFLFGDDFETYGRYYFRKLIEAAAVKPGLLIETPAGIGKTTIIRAIARIYGVRGPAHVVMNGFEASKGLGKYTADQLDQGPVFAVDDQVPSAQLIEFILNFLGGGIAREMYNLKHLRGGQVQFCPVLVMATNNLSTFATTMLKRCKSSEERSAVVSRIITLSPERGASLYARNKWAEWYRALAQSGISDSDAEQHVYKTLAQHMLWEGYRAQAEDVRDPGTGRHGGGNRASYHLTEHGEIDESADKYVAMLRSFLCSDQMLPSIIDPLPEGFDAKGWPCEDGGIPRTMVRIYDERAFSIPWASPVLIVGTWMVVRPNLWDFSQIASGDRSPLWVSALVSAGAAWIYSGTSGRLKLSIPRMSIEQRIVLIDLTGFIRDQGSSEVHPRLAAHIAKYQ